jgi:hypothetical protein
MQHEQACLGRMKLKSAKSLYTGPYSSMILTTFVTRTAPQYDSTTTYITNASDNRKKNPWSESANELYRLSDRRLSAKLVPTFADRGVPRGQRDGSLRPYYRISRPES